MPKYANRVYEVGVNDSPIVSGSGSRMLKLDFVVTVDFGGFTSYGNFKITNITEKTAANFKRGEQIYIKCGYEESQDTIFKGSIRNVFRRREGTETITEIFATGGAIEEKRKFINIGLGQGSKVTDALSAIAAALEIPIIFDDAHFSDSQPFIGGYTMTGDPMTHLKQLAKSYGFSYAVENGRLIINKNGQSRAGTIHEISMFTGMEGIPEITEVGVTVSTRLNPKLKIGAQIEIKSNSQSINYSNVYFQDVPDTAGKGLYTIYKLVFSGNTHGSAWTSKIIGYRSQSQ